jgi:predicted ATPase
MRTRFRCSAGSEKPLVQSVENDRYGLAEAQFREAVRIARHQRARLFELRATVSLARVLDETGRSGEAIAGLQEIASAFEGEQGCDVSEARSLLASLGTAGAGR